MSKLSDFKNSNKEKLKSNVSQAEIQDKFNQYKDMSKEQLNNQLLSEVAKQKMQGTFDYENLERMVNSLQGSLSNQEFENIKRLLESLK